MAYTFEDLIDLDEMTQPCKAPKKERAVRLTKQGLPDKRRESSRKNIGLAQAKMAAFLVKSRKPNRSDDEEESIPATPASTPTVVPVETLIHVPAYEPPGVIPPPPYESDMKALKEQLFLLQDGLQKMTEKKALKQAARELKAAKDLEANTAMQAQIVYNNTIRRQVMFKR